MATGGNLYTVNCGHNASGCTIGTYYHLVGADGLVTACRVAQGGITTILDIDGASMITVSALEVEQATHAIILADTTHFDGVGIAVDAVVTNHLEIEDATVECHITAGMFHSDRFVFPASYTGDIISFVDVKEGDHGHRVFGESGTGRAERGSETVLGEGDSYTRGMLVYAYDDGAGTYVDVSADAASASGSTFAIPGLDTDDALYMASSLVNVDVLQFYGLKISLATAPVVGGGGIDTEFWNGSAWVHFDRMLTDSGGSYWPHGESLAQSPGSYQMRFDPTMLTTWAKNDPITPAIGTSYYWVRLRNTGGVTTAPVFEQFKLHTNRTEINADGYIEYMGGSRPIAELPWSVGLLGDVGSTMGDDDIWMGENIGRAFTDAVFNSDGDYAGFNTKLPDATDTSVPITLQFATMATADDAAARFTVHWGYTSEGDTLYVANPGGPVTNQWSTTLASSAVTLNLLKWWTVELDISPMVARKNAGFGDMLWVSIERHTDTTQSQVLVGISGQYTKWCEGGHQ